MTDNQIEVRLMEELTEIFQTTTDKLTRDTRFKEDLNASSMEKMSLSGVLTEMTGEIVTYSQVNRCKTVGALIDFACTKLAEE